MKKQKKINGEEKPPSSTKKRLNNHKKNGFINGLLPKKIGIIYSDVKREYFPTEMQYLTEKDAFRDAKIVASYIEKLGIKTELFPGNDSLAIRLKRKKPDMVFNLIGSVRGKEYLSGTIPALLELLEIPYTGAGMFGETLVYNKFLVKKMLEQNGIPVPHYQLFNEPNDPLESNMRFPLIMKLNEIHGAVEITDNAVVENESDLRKRLKYLIRTYDQPVLVEEFIVGKEITAILLEGKNKKVYLAEKVFQKKKKYIYMTFEDQWMDKEDSFFYRPYKDTVLQEYVKRAFEICRMADYGKFDIRIDQSGRYFFLDANTNPAFGPKETDCAIANILDLYNISFFEILKRLIINTMRDFTGKSLLPIVNGKE